MFEQLKELLGDEIDPVLVGKVYNACLKDIIGIGHRLLPLAAEKPEEVTIGMVLALLVYVSFGKDALEKCDVDIEGLKRLAEEAAKDSEALSSFLLSARKTGLT